MMGVLGGVPLALTIGIGGLGLAIAAALENAKEFPRLQAFADEHGFELTRGGVGRPYCLSARRRGRQIVIQRIVESRQNELWRGFSIEVELPGRLPDTLSARVARPGHRVRGPQDLVIACGDEAEWSRLRGQHALMAWMVEVFSKLEGVRIRGNWLALEVTADLFRTLPVVERLVGEGDRLAAALVWKPGEQARHVLPLAPVQTLGARRPPPPPEEEVEASAPVDGQVAAMLAELKAGATMESRGQFTLDAGRAMERLRSARLERRSAYIFDLIRAGVARSSTVIEVNQQLGTLTVRFDGEPYSHGELEQAAAAVFVSGQDGRAWSVRHLALGLQGALGSAPRFVRVESGLHQVTLRDNGEPAEHQQQPVPASRTTITVTATVRGFMGGSNMHPLYEVSRRPLVSNTHIMVGDRRRSRSPLALVPFGRAQVSARGVMGLVGFDLERPGHGAQIMVGQHGVMLDAPTVPGGLDGYRAIFMLDDPETDLTGLRLVDGQQRAELMWLAESSIPTAFAALANELAPGVEGVSPAHERQLERARQLVRRHLYGMPSRDALHSSRLAVLGSACVWPLATGGHVSSLALFGQHTQTGFVRFQNTVGSGPPRPGALDAPRLGPADRSLLLAWFGAALREVQ